ncbi:MAG: amino acid adenylation domain-containing protein, partial [Moorea sp. SIO4E2]|uniref:amino acid adenylation domain-containing protein n=1 Tax=Moorena sp. SIO4E2 TaxID=2607826 RepID=UPI0013BE481D
EFVGRKDFQVKLRGYRIELGEIEAALVQHSQVKEAVVIAREDSPGDKRLVAYVVPTESQPVISQLRSLLKTQLPDYMIPAAFVVLESLPLTPNGKVNRRALPAPEVDPTALASFVAPQTPSQELLADIYGSVLGIKHLGIHDNFFELGGHSLLATQVISRLRETFSVEIPLRSIFEAPTVAQLTEHINRIRNTQEQIPIAPAIIGVSRQQKLPLSFAQQRLWFLDQLFEGDSSAYNMLAVLQLTGELDIDALSGALTEIINRHEVLRTRFESVGAMPVQVIEAECQLSLPVIDLRELSPPQQSQQVQQLAKAEGKQLFDLEQTPLVRASVLQLSEQKHILLLNVHHIAFDGWSRGIFLKELSVIYTALSSGQPSPLAELPIQYADYAAWQRQWLLGEVLETQLNYWKQQLSGELPVLELPLDYPRPPVQRYTGGKTSLKLSEQLTSSLKQLSQLEGVTLYMTLLAAFKVLLSRYSGQSDIIVGTPIANRRHSQLEGLIGFFVNTLVLRTELGGNPSFEELLGRVREVTLGAYGHQEMPFEKLVEELQPQRDLSRNPIFQVWFDMVNVPRNPLELPGITVENRLFSEPQSKFDLTVYVREVSEAIQLKLVYNAELFAQERIAQMVEQLQYLLMQVVDNPEAKIANLSLVTPAAQRLLPDPKAALLEPYYEPVTVTFNAWAQQTPEQPAISQGSRSWTYKQLAETAQAIAQRIRTEGVKPGEVVAVSGDRSFGLIASMMGILSSGAVMLVIEPKLPSSRQQLMLEQTQARYLFYVSEQPLKTEQMWQGVSCIHIDPDTGYLKTSDEATVETLTLETISPEDAAYIFFTSGTTGVPKGVLGTHKGLAHFLQWQRETFAIGPDNCVAQLISLSFDPVLRDIFLPLTSGATLCLPTQTDDLVSHRLFSWLETQRISVVHTVPALARMWLGNVPPGIELKSLRWLFFAGEPLTAQLVNQWRSAFPDSGKIVNLYGPTETTMAKCYYQVPENPLPGVQPVGIAQPQTQVLILSQNQQLCGIGETGEIVLRTPFRTKGYINASTENQRRFIQNPYREDPSDQWYLTGDLGRYRADGTVEIIGRKDEQVKIRGLRIELGEIEATLAKHPDLREVAVIAREDSPGDKRLVAYVVPTESQPVISQLRSLLKTQLPDYMIPGVFVVLESLPLTPNGKVNRRALPAPEVDPTALASFVPPQTPSQELLADIYGSVLGIKQVGIHDNFFELGGHSLLATQVISRLRETFGLEIPLRSIFEAPTVAELEGQINRIRNTQEQLPIAPAITTVSRQQELPLSFAQQRLWFLHELFEGDSSAYNMLAVLQLTGQLNIDALSGALTEIINRHQVLRTRFESVGTMQFQVIEAEYQLRLPVIDLRELSPPQQSQQVQQLAKAEGKQPFDLEQSPLVRARVLQLSEQKHILLLNVHHIAFDGWSRGIFLQELSVIYTALSSGQPSPLAELPIQYADYAAWQRQWLQGEVLETQLNYWKQQLSGELPVLELPLDYPRPPVPSYTGGKKSLKLSEKLTSSLKQLSQQQGVTLYMTLLAAFKVLLSRYSGHSDIIVGTPIANRHRTELEGLIGFFVNTLVLRTELGGNPSFRELLGRVREVSLGAYGHQEMPFEKLVEELQPQRDLSRNPLFQVMFALQNVPKGRWELPQLAVTPLKVENLTSKFDLSVILSETETRLEGRWEYNADLFEGATIERMIGNFKTLLEAIVTHPEQKVGELPLLTSRERHQLLVEWNDTKAEYPQDKCIHQLFEEQVERTPDGVAVVFEQEQITYGELNAKANQLAHYLQSLGVGPEVLVGICVERSIEMIIGLLGILKAGGAYVPLDPMYPSERIAYILSSSKIKLLVTQENLLVSLPNFSAQAVCLDIDSQRIAQCSTCNSVRIFQPDNLAYVIYTSGSTGQPKGVEICHKSLVNFLSSMEVAPGLSHVDSILAITTICFDIAALEIYLPLAVGAKILMVTREVVTDGERLLSKLENSGATAMQATPATWRMLLAAGWQGSPQLKIICGGEALPQELAKCLLQKGASLWNLYGPTETTVWSMTCQVNSSQQSSFYADVSESIGTPIANTQIYLLDCHLQPVPIGVPGELHIGGAGLARGYLNRPELTEAKFIPNPFSNKPGSRLYKTGDLARYLPDGNIEFIGRIDNQVKIRGYRIELGEIEAVLAQHSQVKEAVVIAREDSPGDKRLVAYVVPTESQAVISQLRSLLKTQLPDYMIPAAFVVLESLPLTPNGKVNRRALPAPDVSTQEAGAIEPRNITELQLVQIWSEVLNIPAVGVQDNFFDLGGHSLLAVRLMACIEQQFGTNLALSTLFTEPTIEAQVSLLSAATNTQLFSPLVPIRPTGSLPPFFCIHEIAGHVLGYAALARQLGVEQPFYGLQAVGLNGEKKPLTRICDMATAYIKEIQTVQPQGPYQLGGWSFGGIVAFEIAQQLQALGHDIALLALIDSPNPTILNQPQPDQAMLVNSFARILSRRFDKKLAVSADELQQLGLDEQLNYIFKEAKRLQILPPEIGLEQIRQLFAVFQANSQAKHSYVPQPYSGQLTLFSAEEKSEQLAEQQIQAWSSLATGGIKIHKLPGDHFSIIRSEALAQELRLYLGL